MTNARGVDPAGYSKSFDDLQFSVGSNRIPLYPEEGWEIIAEPPLALAAWYDDRVHEHVLNGRPLPSDFGFVEDFPWDRYTKRALGWSQWELESFRDGFASKNSTAFGQWCLNSVARVPLSFVRCRCFDAIERGASFRRLGASVAVLLESEQTGRPSGDPSHQADAEDGGSADLPSHQSFQLPSTALEP